MTFANPSVMPACDGHFGQFVVVIATDRQLGSRICRKMMEAEPKLQGLDPAQGRLLQVSSAIVDELSRAMRAGTVAFSRNAEEPAIPAAASTSNRQNLMLSKRLRTVRLRKNMSVFELAQKSGVQLQVLVDCEKEGQEPDRTTFPRLAMALGVHPNDLLSA